MSRGPRNPIAIALWVNAALLGGILLVMLGRGLPSGNEAFAQQAMPPIAGGGGLFFMPGQIDANMYGIYVMDVDRQTLMMYQYFRGNKTLELIAARDIRYDRDLRIFNTSPHPDEIAKLIELEADDARVKESGDNAARSTAEDPNRPQEDAQPTDGETDNE